VIAEDNVLLREGISALLRDDGFDVVAAVPDAAQLLSAVGALTPDLVIADVRMPPTHTDEGLRAALEIRARWPDVGIVVLSQYVEERYATELLARETRGTGYLLKDRVADVAEFTASLRRVADGGTALDPEVVRQLLARRRAGDPAHRPRAGSAVSDGRGALQQQHRRDHGRLDRRRREARCKHPREAGTAARRPQPPAGTRRAQLPAGRELTAR
jgi:DNA-binding NarL/FixJ family response regulator